MGVHPGCSVCLIAAASLVAVETYVGETISAAKVAFVCGPWSVGAVVLLSAGPSSYFCIHQLLFPCLEVLVQSASPHHAVSCKVLPELGVDVECFHVSLADILVPQLWTIQPASQPPAAGLPIPAHVTQGCPVFTAPT